MCHLCHPERAETQRGQSLCLTKALPGDWVGMSAWLPAKSRQGNVCTSQYPKKKTVPRHPQANRKTHFEKSNMD